MDFHLSREGLERNPAMEEAVVYNRLVQVYVCMYVCNHDRMEGEPVYNRIVKVCVYVCMYLCMYLQKKPWQKEQEATVME